MQSAPRVLSVNVSAGGVPKTPVDRAWVGLLGVEGDAHRDRTQHGGPHRAVCLFGIEAIERLQAEGHPVEPGSVGENLTTLGIEWSLLPVGTRARIGERLLLELAGPTTPCSTQKPNFLGGRFSRISIDLHPSDSRMYARVLEEGAVGPGDPIEVLPPAAGSRAPIEALLQRIDPVERAGSLRLWAAANAAGLNVQVLDDGDLCAGASRTLASRAFNHAQGLRMLPQLLPEVLAHFDAVGSVAVIPHAAPTLGAEPAATIAVHAADVSELTSPAQPDEVGVVRVAAGDATTEEWASTYVAEMDQAHSAAWRALVPHLLATRGVYGFLARRSGTPVGVGLLHVKRGVGLLKGAYVQPQARRRGIQRALIDARIRTAQELGCDMVAAMAEEGSASARNITGAGLRHVDSHPVFEYVPHAASLLS